MRNIKNDDIAIRTIIGKQIYCLIVYSDILKEGFTMGLRSKLVIEYKGMFLFALFYFIVGVVNFLIMGIYGLDLSHVALVAVLSLITAFGLYRLQKWSLWFVVGLFFIATTYGAFTLNVFLRNYSTNPELSGLLAILPWIIYLVLTWIATAYVAAKRKNLK